jgi:hypothetical protein
MRPAVAACGADVLAAPVASPRSARRKDAELVFTGVMSRCIRFFPAFFSSTGWRYPSPIGIEGKS